MKTEAIKALVRAGTNLYPGVHESMIQEAAMSKVDPRMIPWDKMVKSLAKLTSSTEKGVRTLAKRGSEPAPEATAAAVAQKGTEIAKDAATAHVTAQFSGPLAAVMKEAAGTKVLPAGLIASGVASGKALIPVTIKGCLSGHVKNLKFAIREAYPFLSSQEARSMAVEAIQNQYRDAFQRATPEHRFIVYVDPNVAKDIPQELHTNRKGLCAWLMAHGLSEPERYIRPAAPGMELETGLGPEPAGEMAPLEVGKPPGPKESAWVKDMNKPESTIGMTCTVIGAVLAFVGWWQLNEEARKKEGAAKITANHKLNFQICAAMGATLETIGKTMATVMEKTAVVGSNARKVIAILKGGGVALGAVAGFAAAYYEWKKMGDDDRLVNRGLWYAHLVSGAVGLVGSFLAAAALIWPSISSLPLMIVGSWILAAAGVIVLILIEGLTDKIGDWLKQCAWGALGSGVRYSTFEEELSALRGAATT